MSSHVQPSIRRTLMRPGIAPEVKSSLFFPMVSAAEGGSGLGLSIAQSLISQHGGLIECTSKPGKTIFSVLIPVERGNG